jgi:CheY-like chemotaxis protein
VRLLLVDDNPINLEVASGLFTKEGCRITAVSSGPEALATLRAAPGRFDAVLMDVQMPEMDGYQTTRLIRTDLKQDALPIVAISAGVLWEERDKCRAAGMNGFISKPLDLDEAVLLLDSLLASKEGRQRALPQEPSVRVPFDLSVAFGAEGHAGPMRRSLLKLFLEDNVAMLSSIRAGIESGDLRGAAGALHRLRGTAAVLGANRLAESTRVLEAQLGPSGSAARSAIAEYESALKEALEAAHSFLVHNG